MDASAISKNSGIMVPGSPPSLTSAFEPFSSFLEQFSPEQLPERFFSLKISRELSKLIKSAGSIRIFLSFKTKLNLFASYPRGG
jgi:hypothetical protein